MKYLTPAVVLTAFCASAAFAADTDNICKVIRVDPGAKPIRDISKSTCAPLVGYAGSHEDEDCKTLYETDREATARAFRRSRGATATSRSIRRTTRGC